MVQTGAHSGGECSPVLQQIELLRVLSSPFPLFFLYSSYLQDDRVTQPAKTRPRTSPVHSSGMLLFLEKGARVHIVFFSEPSLRVGGYQLQCHGPLLRRHDTNLAWKISFPDILWLETL